MPPHMFGRSGRAPQPTDITSPTSSEDLSASHLNRTGHFEEHQRLEDRPFDEAFQVVDEESDDGRNSDMSTPAASAALPRPRPTRESPASPADTSLLSPAAGVSRMSPPSDEGFSSSSTSSESSEEVNHRSRPAARPSSSHMSGSRGGAGLSGTAASHSGEVRDLFRYIAQYQPRGPSPPATFQPFIPDYVPAVDEVDAFIKIPRPDGVADGLGLVVLDEPSLTPSDPALLELRLRATSRVVTSDKPAVSVRSIPSAQSKPKEVAQLHESKPADVVHFSRKMPDIESLMQEWPPGVEEALPSSLPTDLSLEDTARLVCAAMGVPVYSSKGEGDSSSIESLYVLFTLYEEFISNQHFAVDVN